MKKSLLFLLLTPFILGSCSLNLKDSSKGQNINDEEEYDEDNEEEKISLYSIKITKKPAKTTYFVGETFDPTGMEVTANYSDKSSKVITDYIYSTEPLKLGTTSITINYKTKKATQSIVVKEKPTEELDEYTKTVVFHNSTFASLFPDSTNFDQESKYDELCNYIDGQLEYYDLINKITIIKGTSRKVNSDTYLQIGTRSGDGELTWECKEKIYKVEVKAMAYSKYDTYNKVWNIDSGVSLTVGDKTTALNKVDGEGSPQIQTLTPVEFNSGVTSFTISSTGGRALISEMTITWRG